MLFEDPTPRVRYHLNPLVEVVCEVQWREAKLSDEALTALMGRASESYPVGDNAEIDCMLARDESGSWAISAWNDFVALTTLRYTSWEEMRGRFVQLLELLPDEDARNIRAVSVKYVDVIIPTRLGLEQRWGELLNRELVGMLDGALSEALVGIVSTAQVRLSEGDQVRLMHGLTEDPETEERGYMIDALLWSEEVDGALEALAKMDKFNRCARSVFHWCTTERLRDAMHPELLEY